MTDQDVLDLAYKTLMVAIQVAAPALVAAVLTGLLVSIFQAATQINEQTLSFIPKVLAMTVVMVLAGPWIMDKMLGFTKDLINGIPQMLH
jgi:flagellar biosynthetic protein FliQ